MLGLEKQAYHVYAVFVLLEQTLTEAVQHAFRSPANRSNIVSAEGASWYAGEIISILTPTRKR